MESSTIKGAFVGVSRSRASSLEEEEVEEEDAIAVLLQVAESSSPVLGRPSSSRRSE